MAESVPDAFASPPKEKVGLRAREVPPDLVIPIKDQVALYVYRKVKTEGGVVLPDQAIDSGSVESAKCRVIAAGPKCEQVKAGDLVLIHPKAQGQILRFRGEKYILVTEDMLGGIVNTAKYPSLDPDWDGTDAGLAS